MRLSLVLILAESVLAAIICLISTGCAAGAAGQGVTVVTVRPPWDYATHAQLVILPPHLDPSLPADRVEAARAAAERLAGELAQRLEAGGVFKLSSTDALRGVLSAAEIASLTRQPDAPGAMPAGQVAGVQALVVLQLNDCELMQSRQATQHPVYARDMNGRLMLDRRRQPIIEGQRPAEEYRHAARVGAKLRVLDVKTGAVLLRLDVPPVLMEKERDEAPPEQTPRDLAFAAASQLAEEFSRQMTPQRITVRLKPAMLTLASGYFDGRYEELESIPRGLEHFLVVVRDLPRGCDYNRFRLVIRSGQGETLAEQDFIWTGGAPAGVTMDVPVSKLADAGGTKLQAELLSLGDDHPMLTRVINFGDERAAR